MKESAIGSSAPTVVYDAYIDYAKEHALDVPMPLAVSICMDVAADLGLRLKSKSDSTLVFRERLLLGGAWLTTFGHSPAPTSPLWRKRRRQVFRASLRANRQDGGGYSAPWRS